MKILNRKNYIDEKDFNLMVEGAGIPAPTEDSKDDSAVDENIEIEMGENYPDTSALAKEKHEEELDEQINKAAGDRSSTWPDPSEF